jgi:hypothetical protein
MVTVPSLDPMINHIPGLKLIPVVVTSFDETD